MTKADDPFDVLGVGIEATDAEVKAAYYAGCKVTHSDLGGSDQAFYRVKAAYEALKTPSDRRAAAAARRASLDPFAAFDSAFAELERAESQRRDFGSRKGPDVRRRLNLALEQAFRGGVFPLVGPSVRCDLCAGTGALGSGAATRKCSVCGGDGGAPRWRCSVEVAPGIVSGAMVLVEGGGLPPPVGRGRRGDLYVEVCVEDHAVLRRVGDDLRAAVRLQVWDAALGCETAIRGVDGSSVVVRYPPGTQSGQVFRIAGSGMPTGRGRRGDLLAEVEVVVPDGRVAPFAALFARMREAAGQR